MRPAPSCARDVDVLTGASRARRRRLAAAEPLVNAVVAARLAVLPHRSSRRAWAACCSDRAADGELVRCRVQRRQPAADRRRTATTGRRWPGSSPADPQVCTSIVGAADAVTAMWAVLEPHWGPAAGDPRRRSRCWPCTAATRSTARPDRRVRVMHPDEIEPLPPGRRRDVRRGARASRRSPGATARPYRRRVESLLAAGRAFGIVDRAGRMEFKADIGALTDSTCQLQGVWVRPDLRGAGLGTAALAGGPRSRAAPRADGQPLRQRLQHGRPAHVRERSACARWRR